MKKFSILLLAISIFLISACHSADDGHNHSTHSHNTAKTEEETTYKNVYKAEIKAEPAAINAGQPIKFTFTVKNEKGEQKKDFQIVHEKPMHLIAVSEDLAEFYHLHPELQADGTFSLEFTFPNGGNYFFFADYTPKDANQFLDKFPIEVAGAKRAPVTLDADLNFEKVSDDLKIVMKPDAQIESAKEMMLNFSVKDAKTNAPITDLENYLGEKAHFVIISKDLKDFVHAHPMSGDNVKIDKAQNSEVPTVAAHVSFPNDGIYKMFVEVKRAGKIVMFPFVLDVKKGKTEKIIDNAKIPDGAYKITVSKDGFAPSEISLNGANGIKLAFLRVDSENCGDEIVFKDLNITKKLPVGEVVVVEIPKDKKGEINFACGMDMYKGKIVVE